MGALSASENASKTTQNHSKVKIQQNWFSEPNRVMYYLTTAGCYRPLLSHNRLTSAVIAQKVPKVKSRDTELLRTPNQSRIGLLRKKLCMSKDRHF